MDTKTTELDIADVMPSESNTRVDYNGADMAELIRSIESVGLLNPILVRDRTPDMGDIHGRGRYEIVAGHRRFHAIKTLGRPLIAARVIEATEEDAAQIRLIENLHRKDLDAMEEADAFQILRVQFALDIEAIAHRADKSVPYVTRSLALLGLPLAAQSAIRAGFLPAAHGHHIARAPEKERHKLAAFATKVDPWTKRVPTLAELKREIEKKIEKNLTLAPFPKDVAGYGGDTMPACDACPFNTGNQGVLFDGAVSGKCTNPGCYAKRDGAFYKQMAGTGARRWPELKYLGAKVPRYGTDRAFMGFPIIDEKNKKNKKLLAEHPENVAFGIWKTDPSGYGLKKPAFVVVCVKGGEKSKADPAPDRDWEKERYVAQYVNRALLDFADQTVSAIEKPHVLQMLDTNEDDPREITALAKKPFPELVKILWLRWLADYEVADRLTAVGIKAEPIRKRAIAEAEEMYAAANATKETVNG